MECSQPCGGAVRSYLRRFHAILNEMIRGMTGAELTDSISHNFIVQMIPHHRAAIEMSENLLRYTDLAPLRRIAQGIVEEQTKSIGAMEEALPCCGETVNTRQDLCRYGEEFHRITGTMFRRMRDACADCDINANFMREMIPHHQGAIRMSENALARPVCPELVPILQAIIASQEKGVQEMKRLLQRLTC